VWEDYARIVPRHRLDQITETALGRIRSAMTTFGGKTGVAWSGGKDSVVIYHIAGRLGITNGVYVAPDPALEFDDFLRFLREHQPKGVVSLYPHLSIDWLKRHPAYLFPDRFGPADPRTSAGVNAWNRFKWRVQREYMRQEKIDFLLLGRRTIDGNVVGKGGVNRARDGFVAVNPIFDWSHEETIAYVRYHGLPLAPVYSLPGGFRKGPRAWAMTTLDHVLAREPSIYDKHRDWINAALAATPAQDAQKGGR